MKKWISLILVFVALVIALAGCGDKKQKEQYSREPSEQETVTQANDTDESTAETVGNPDKELPRLPIELG